MYIFDTHAHLDAPYFDEPQYFDAVIRRLETSALPLDTHYLLTFAGAVVPAVDAASSVRIVQECTGGKLSQLPCYPAVGVHPNYSHQTVPDDWEVICDLARHGNVVAIGETGLDRYWDDAPIQTQIESLNKHFDLAQQVHKPILIHCRDAWDYFLPIAAERNPGIIHAFSGTPEQALECVELGWYISFAGNLTYRNAKFAPLWDAARAVPADRLLIETDSPYLSPHPLRGKLKHNEPLLAVLVAQRLAELRDETVETIAETTYQNAKRVFAL